MELYKYFVKKSLDDNTYKDKYDEEGFLRKVQKYAVKLGLKSVFYGFLLYHTLGSGSIDVKEKVYIVGALGYFVFPLDLIPDFAPVFGYTDDMFALTMAVTHIRSLLTPDIIANARVSTLRIFGGEENEKRLDEIRDELITELKFN